MSTYTEKNDVESMELVNSVVVGTNFLDSIAMLLNLILDVLKQYVMYLF